MVRYYTRYHSEGAIFGIPLLGEFKGWGRFLPCCLPYGKTGGLQILRCQGFAVADYSFTLDALTLKPSNFYNVRVKSVG